MERNCKSFDVDDAFSRRVRNDVSPDVPAQLIPE